MSPNYITYLHYTSTPGRATQLIHFFLFQSSNYVQFPNIFVASPALKEHLCPMYFSLLLEAFTRRFQRRNV